MKLFKLIILAAISSIFLNFLVYYSSYATNNILFNTDTTFIIKSIWFILSICFFIFFHCLFIAVKSDRTQTTLYYSLLIITVIANVLVYQPIGVYVSLLNGLMVLCCLLLIHFRFTRDFNNLVNPDLQVSHNIVAIFLLFLALTISLNFYILNTNQKQSLMEQIQSFVTQTTATAIDTYTKKSFIPETKTISPQTIVVGNQRIELPKIDINQTQIRNQAIMEVSEQIENYISPYQDYIVAGASALVFITILSLGFLVHILLTTMNFVLFTLLRLTRFVRFETEMIEARRLKL